MAAYRFCNSALGTYRSRLEERDRDRERERVQNLGHIDFLRSVTSVSVGGGGVGYSISFKDLRTNRLNI